MKHASMKAVAVCVCALALVAGVLAGCSSMSLNSATEEQQSNRSYMSQVNEIMEQLSTGLDSFVDAVSRADVVNMRTQADEAYRILDKLDALEAPEDLKDVHESYLDGTEKLRKALDSYIQLFTDAESDDFDWDKYPDKIKKIQSLYDKGVEALQKADETAASKE